MQPSTPPPAERATVPAPSATTDQERIAEYLRASEAMRVALQGMRDATAALGSLAPVGCAL